MSDIAPPPPNKEQQIQAAAAELWECEQAVAYWKDRHDKAKTSMAYLLSDGELSSATLHINDQYKIVSIVQTSLKVAKSTKTYKQLPDIVGIENFNRMFKRDVVLNLDKEFYLTLPEELKEALKEAIFYNTTVTCKYERKKDDS